MNFADYKRFLEWYMGDDEFRERFDRAPAAALREAALSPETSVEFLQAIAAGCRSYNFRPVMERFSAELAELRGFAAALEEANPFTVRCRNACGGNARFEEWRERRRRANRAVLQPLYFDRSFNIAVAYELGVGCSGQCGFCCFDAPPLQENFRYTPENRELWRGVLALFCELLGDRAGAAALYWATDPFDNPDLEKFYRDFYELNQVWPPITTRWPLRDPERTRRFAGEGREHGQPGCRFSMTERGELRRFFRAFSAEEAMDWSLVLNNPESLNRYSASGRARQAEPEMPGRCQEDTTSCCLSGFLVNLCRRSIRLVSPCVPDEANPYGFHLWSEASFRDAAELERVLGGMQERFFPEGPEALPFLRLPPVWNLEIAGGRAEFTSRYLVRRFAVSPQEAALLERLKTGISRREFDREFGGELAFLGKTHGLLETLWKSGMLSEEEENWTGSISRW